MSQGIDTSLGGLLDAIKRQGEAFHAFKETNDERIDALQKGEESKAAELGEKIDRIEVDLNKFGELKTTIEREMKFQRDRLEELEAAAKRPVRTAEQKLNDDYKTLFNRWIRSHGLDQTAENEMKKLQAKARSEFKTVTIGTGADGGVAVPEQIAREINRLELRFSPVRELVKVTQVGTSDYKELVNIRGAAGAWAGESTDRSTVTGTSQLRERTPTQGELYAYPQASEWSLDDVFFNVENWLAEEAAQAFAVLESTAVISGNGTNKPTGLLNTTPVLTADFASPLRSAEVVQYIASDTALSPAVPGLTADSLITLVYALNSMYRSNGIWTMNSTTTGAVRKLKDSQNQYLWAPGLASGQPDRLLGYPVRTWEQMPDIGANNFPIGFGDWRRAYSLVDRVGMRITRDNITNVGFVKFYIRRREGGIITNNDAVKVLRTI